MWREDKREEEYSPGKELFRSLESSVDSVEESDCLRGILRSPPMLFKPCIMLQNIVSVSLHTHASA